MFYPIMVDIFNKKIVIVGGGEIGYRKAKNFLEFGAKIVALSPKFIDKFYKLEKEYKEQIRLINDVYNKEYIYGSFLVIGATSSRKINKQISIDSRDLNILCNIVASKEESGFISPAIVNREGLIVSVSTGGKFPYLCKKIREDMEDKYSKFDKEYMDLLEKLREVVLSEYKDRSQELFNYSIGLNRDELRKFLIELIDKRED